MKTAKQSAAAIAENCRRFNAGEITRDEWSAEQHRLWREVERGQLPIVGSACDRRIASVMALLKIGG